MLRYVIKRLLLMIPTLFGAAVLMFLLMRPIPGDICYLRLASGGGIGRPRTSSHLPRRARPRPADADAVPRLHLGPRRHSISATRCGPVDPIIEEIGLRFQLSLQVAIMATVTAILIAIPLGTISAVKQNTWIDYVGAHVRDRRHRHAVVLARHPDHPRHSGHQQGVVRQAVDAADRLRADLAGSLAQPVDADLAGAGDRATAIPPSPCA